MIVTAVRAVICGADSRVQVVQFGLARQEWLASFFDLPDGILRS